MLNFTPQQRAALIRPALKIIEDDLVRQECGRSPEADEQALRACFRLALIRADQAGFSEKGAAIIYVQTAFQFGLGFATDPLHPWAIPAIQSREPAVERGELLQRAVNIAAPALTTAEWRHADSTAQTLQGAMNSQIPADLPTRVLQQLATGIRRANGLNPLGIQQLKAAAAALASSSGLEGPLATSIFLLPVVLYGHHCAADPCYSCLNTPAADAQTALATIRRRIAPYLAEPPAKMRILPNGQRLQSITLSTSLPFPEERRRV